MKGPTDETIHKASMQKWEDPMTELSRLAAELSCLPDGVELHLQNWTDSLQNLVEELSLTDNATELNSTYQEKLNKLVAELSKRIEFDGQCRRVELNILQVLTPIL